VNRCDRREGPRGSGVSHQARCSGRCHQGQTGSLLRPRTGRLLRPGTPAGRRARDRPAQNQALTRSGPHLHGS
jgi:hypothetical protein